LQLHERRPNVSVDKRTRHRGPRAEPA
jgi:hypothetical protein